jgi:hypothetical protein
MCLLYIHRTLLLQRQLQLDLTKIRSGKRNCDGRSNFLPLYKRYIYLPPLCDVTRTSSNCSTNLTSTTETKVPKRVAYTLPLRHSRSCWQQCCGSHVAFRTAAGRSWSSHARWVVEMYFVIAETVGRRTAVRTFVRMRTGHPRNRSSTHGSDGKFITSRKR